MRVPNRTLDTAQMPLRFSVQRTRSMRLDARDGILTYAASRLGCAEACVVSNRLYTRRISLLDPVRTLGNKHSASGLLSMRRIWAGLPAVAWVSGRPAFAEATAGAPAFAW